jgi:hypothetical protein
MSSAVATIALAVMGPIDGAVASSRIAGSVLTNAAIRRSAASIWSLIGAKI